MPASSKTDNNYNEEAKPAPENRLPDGVEVDPRKFPEAGARILIENLSSSLSGINDNTLKGLGISKRDLVTHRDAIRSALFNVIREEADAAKPRLRRTAVAYLGQLQYGEATEVLGGLATSYDESAAIRGLAAEALCRIGGDVCADLLRGTLDDPDSTVRERGAKALGIIGRQSDGDFLAALASADRDPVVSSAANLGARKLLSRTDFGRLPVEVKRPKSRKARYSKEEDSIVRPIGRDARRVQPNYPIRRNDGPTGGVDQVTTARFEDYEVGMVSASQSYTLDRSPVSGRTRLSVLGAAKLSDRALHSGAARSQWQLSTKIMDQISTAPMPGRRLAMRSEDGLSPKALTYVPATDAAPVITDLGPDVPTVWRGGAFGINVDFDTPGEQVPVWLKLTIRMPGSSPQERWFAVSKAQQESGRINVRGLRAAQSGRMSISARLYSSGGGVATAQSQHVVFTPNPHSVSLVPQTTGANGKGPAHHNSGEDRFYCYATCTFTNGHPSPLTVGPTVTCTVTDGGSHVATFDFSIGTRTVAAQSSLVLGIYTSHGSSSDVYDVFEGFGDVRMEFTFETSEGPIDDWHVWAAMGQIDLALNFVGNMSSSTRSTFQDVVENEASAVFEQQGFYIPDTQRFLLPSSDSDWSRYRDIEMEDNKDSDCTAGSDEADDLRDDWSSPTDLLDIWVVESFSGPACSANVGGFSPVDGPTSKGGSRSGLLIQLAGINLGTQFGRDLMGIVVAHEVGHFLGLEHSTTNDNFMEASVGTANTDITHGQYITMADHGFVERFVP